MFKILALLFSTWVLYQVFSHWPRENPQLIFCDVGQGDAILVQHKFMQLLVDTGKKSGEVLKCLRENMPLFDKNIEFLLLTHMDSDHIGGAPLVLDGFSVSFLVTNPSAKESADFKLLQQSVLSKRHQGMRVLSGFAGLRLALSSLVEFTLLSPQEDVARQMWAKHDFSEATLSDKKSAFEDFSVSEMNENDLSIGAIVRIGSVCFVLTGDLEVAGEMAVIESGLTEDCDVLKAGHHGSKTSSLPEFVNSFSPEIVVVSSGKNNSYGHPSPQVLDFFRDQFISILRTDELGSIRFESDGDQYWLR